MHIMIKKAFMAAAMVSFCLAVSFPAYAEESVGTNVTVVEETESATESAKEQVSHKTRTSVTSDDDYVPEGPGAVKEKEEVPEPKDVSLGKFSITGYCSCDKCSGGHGLTYSGTVPTPNHTISADLTKFPLGTKLKVDGIVYTVEDKGSSVNGNILDIFYGTHAEALAKGTYTAEVFLVEE